MVLAVSVFGTLSGSQIQSQGVELKFGFGWSGAFTRSKGTCHCEIHVDAHMVPT